jgi:hypothetical protein
MNFTEAHMLRRVNDIPAVDVERIRREFWASSYAQKILAAEEQRMEMLRWAWTPEHLKKDDKTRTSPAKVLPTSRNARAAREKQTDELATHTRRAAGGY